MAVGQLRGGHQVLGDVKARLLRVEYDPAAVSVGAIQKALESVGYESTVVT